MMKVYAVRAGIAKQVFQVPGMNEHGVATGRKTLGRAKVRQYFVQFFCTVLDREEACAGAHYWAREPRKPGHTVTLMASQFVMPYRVSPSTESGNGARSL
jgi:transposase